MRLMRCCLRPAWGLPRGCMGAAAWVTYTRPGHPRLRVLAGPCSLVLSGPCSLVQGAAGAYQPKVSQASGTSGWAVTQPLAASQLGCPCSEADEVLLKTCMGAAMGAAKGLHGGCLLGAAQMGAAQGLPRGCSLSDLYASRSPQTQGACKSLQPCAGSCRSLAGHLHAL